MAVQPDTINDASLLSFQNPDSKAPSTLPTTEHIIELSKRFAPDVPTEIINNVYRIESNYGRDTSSYRSKEIPGKFVNGVQATRRGVFQIQDSAGTAFAGDPVTSLAASSFKLSKTEVPYDNTNLTHLAAAGLSKIQVDWVKAAGDVEKFMDYYHGTGGNNVAGKMSRADYAAQWYQTGKYAGRSNAPPELSGQSINLFNPAEVAQVTQQKESIASNLAAKLKEAASSQMFDLQNILGMVDKVGETVKKGIDIAFGEDVAKADRAKQFAREAGLDVGDSTGLAARAGEAMRKNLSNLLDSQEALDKKRANPIFAIMDGFTGGKVSKPYTDEIKQLQVQGTQINQGISELQARASAAQSIGASQVASFSEAHYTAIKNQQDAKTDLDKAKLRYDGNVKAANMERQFDTALSGINNSAARLELTQQQAVLSNQRAEIQAGYKALEEGRKDASSKIALELKNEALEKAEATNLLRASELKTANMIGAKIGQTPETVLKAYKAGDKSVQALYFALGDKPTAGGLELAARNNLLTPEQKTARNLSQGPGGWLNSSVVATARALTEDESKIGRKSTLDSLQVTDASFSRVGELQNRIVSTGNTKPQDANPYAAQHKAILSSDPAILSSLINGESADKELLAKVVNSQFYKVLKEKTVNEKSVGDDTVLNLGTRLVNNRAMTPQQAAEQTNAYYELAIKLNNNTRNYAAVGVATQDSYGIPFVGNIALGKLIYDVYSSHTPMNFTGFNEAVVKGTNPGSTTEAAVASTPTTSYAAMLRYYLQASIAEK